MTISIQVDEQKLSEHAAKVLINSKNKSQFIRDAIEFFANAQTPLHSVHGAGVDHEVHAALGEIKEMIRDLINISIDRRITPGIDEGKIDHVETTNIENEIVISGSISESLSRQEKQENTETIEIPECYLKF